MEPVDASASASQSEWMQEYQSSCLSHLSDDHLMHFATNVRRELESWQQSLVDGRSKNADAWLVDADQRFIVLLFIFTC